MASLLQNGLERKLFLNLILNLLSLIYVINMDVFIFHHDHKYNHVFENKNKFHF